MNVEIAERLAKRRREAGYSQENLAEQLGVSRQAVSKWERSESSPDTDNLIALAQLYGVSLDDLLYVDESIKDDIAFEATDRATAGSEANVVEPDTEAENAASESAPEASDPADTESKAKTDKTKVKIGFGGIHVNDGDDYVHVSWRDGVHVKDSEQGEEVHVGWSGVHVTEGQKSDSSEPKEHKTQCDDAKVIINGEEFDSFHDARDKYSRKYGNKSGSWMKFPFSLLAILVYILLGVFLNAWVIGVLVFLTIPVYYMSVHAISERKPAHFFAGIYPVAAVAWFFYMAIALNEPHPAWVIFLTIPIYEWIVHACSRARKRSKVKDDVINVDAQA